MARKKMTETTEQFPHTPSEVIAGLPAEVSEDTAADIKKAVTTNQILGAEPEQKVEVPVPRSPVIERLLVRHDFNEHDMAEFGRSVVRQHRVVEGLEAELKSIKTSYSGKIQSAEAERARIAQIIGDGFEMREVPAFALVHIDKKERQAWKVYYRADDGTFMRKEGIPWTSGVTFDMFTMVPDGHVLTEPLPKEARGNLV